MKKTAPKIPVFKAQTSPNRPGQWFVVAKNQSEVFCADGDIAEQLAMDVANKLNAIVEPPA